MGRIEQAEKRDQRNQKLLGQMQPYMQLVKEREEIK